MPAKGSTSSSLLIRAKGSGSTAAHNSPTIRTADMAPGRVISAVYKNPHATFLHKIPYGHSAADVAAGAFRFGMIYGAWAHEEVRDEKAEKDFRKDTD
ncbi:uncharacterized protein J7T55_010416 [Diaporthe amygdali]|uniref:uncharacterized protein n=1 Tax=Phomopsis amygdali TaxID=1214568 RepID=UPI0022FDB83B|nr:uncharacterized protein J7T55_010416 [Diaporthe amygdali]KAJ0115593.1 uncharacterized protein J7T55_010416 [Diaporthe amygdali]